MSDPLFTASDSGVDFAFGLAVWQLFVRKRDLRRDSTAAEAATSKSEAGTL